MAKMIAGTRPVELPCYPLRTDLHQQMSLAGLRGTTTVTNTVGLRTVDVSAANVYAVINPPPTGAPHVLLAAHYDGVGDDPSSDSPPLPITPPVSPSSSKSPGTYALIHYRSASASRSSTPKKPAPTAPRTPVPAGTQVINLDEAGSLHHAAAVEAGGPAHSLLDTLNAAARTIGLPLRAKPCPPTTAGTPPPDTPLSASAWHAWLPDTRRDP